MRAVQLFITLLAVGCSTAAGSTVDAPRVVLRPAFSAAPTAASAPQDAGVVAAAPSVQVVRLPDQPYDDLVPTHRSLDIAAGDLPGPAFPAGTVYVATMDPKKPTSPVSVTEWDLARAAIVRSIELPISTDEVMPWILRVGDHLRVLVSGMDSVSYLQLTRDLKIEHTERWVGHFFVPGIDAFSADDKLTAVTYSGNAATVSRGDPGLILVTFDASGRRSARRIVQRPDPGESMVDSQGPNAVVLDGRVFVLRCMFKSGVDLLALTPDLRMEKRVVVSREPDYTMDLHARGGRLQVDSGYPERRSVEFSTNLERLGPTTPAEESPGVKLGDVTVAMCIHSGRGWLAWTRTDAAPCASSPSYLRDAPPPYTSEP